MKVLAIELEVGDVIVWGDKVLTINRKILNRNGRQLHIVASDRSNHIAIGIRVDEEVEVRREETK